MDDLDKILGDQGKETPSTEPAKEPENKEPKKDPEILSKEQHLANVNKAISEANAELKKKREALKNDGKEPEEEIPVINLKDPNSKAWDKHISEKVDPVAQEMEAEKNEIFKFTFQDFISQHPSLASSPDKMKAVISTYNVLKQNTGRTKEGVMHDLRRAYAAENFEVLTDEKRNARIKKAQQDAIYSDAGVSRGAGNYLQERESEPTYDDQDLAILGKWGMSPQEHAKMVKEQNEKAAQEV